MELLALCLTCVFSYIVLFLTAKVIGHKQVSQLDFFDYITGITLGSIAAEFATELEKPWKPLVAMAIYGGITLLIGLTTRKFPRTRKYLNGTSSLIVDNGKIIEKNVKQLGFDLNWLSKQMARHGIHSPKDVFLAVSDRNQNIIFYKKDS